MYEQKIDRNLLKKYDRPGPRYTSYPTVPEWTDRFGPDDYIKALENSASSDQALSLYVHIPFCRARCYYCGCNTCITKDPDRPDNYLKLIDNEIKLVRKHLGKRNRLAQLHWGGGTPTYLSEDQMRRLFGSITEHFTLDPNAEAAIEVDPRVTTPAHLRLLREFGFNRISLGVQDLNPDVQEAIGRHQTVAQTEELFNLCRELGFGGINVDLIYGLPRQTISEFAKTVERIIEWGADRVAVYSYAHLPRVMAHQKKIDESTLPPTEKKFELFETALIGFLNASYVQIGMDHFAKPDDELARSLAEGKLHRNFMGYTTRFTDTMVGIGMSSIGDLDNTFVQNLSGIDSYMNAITENKPAVYRGLRLSEDDRIRRATILSLMCNFVLKFEMLEREFGVSYGDYFSAEDSDLDEFISDGLLERSDKEVRVTPPGRVFVRNIAMVFDAYLRTKTDGESPLFSRTI